MIFVILFTLMIAAMLLALVRLILGPSLPDRVVALDLIAVSAVGMTGIYAVFTDQPIYLDEAMVLALIAFLGTSAYAHFIEKGGVPWRKS
ncbi:MAG: cation:proton antiporter [Chloroflexi bacterium]|nr:cation:proton antiporter [Chloroflexota bacterium]